MRRFRRGDSEELLLCRALVEQVDRLAERRVVRKIATLCGGVAEGEVRDALLEQAIDVTCRRVVVLAIDRHTLRLQPTQQLLTPLRVDREVLVRPFFDSSSE